MCKKQTSVSHSSTESEIISLDAGLRLDGIPALDLWDLIVAILHGNTHQSNQVRRDPFQSPTQKKIPVKTGDLNNVDFISSNVNSSRKEALLYIFEDNEAVIQMIIKGRSPTMRHVSRTLRVALDWLFDRTNLDTKTQIKHIDTKNQFADILTEGNFTRDEWNHLLCLFNISHFFSSINNLEAMSKRRPEDAGEERVTAKSKPMMNLVSRYSARDPNVLALTASESPGKTRSESQNVPLSSLNVQQTSTGRPVDDKFVIDDDMDSDTAAESNLSLKSRSFLNRVNDRLRRCWTVLQKIQCETLINVLCFGECLCFRQWKHLYSWERISQTIYVPSKIQGKMSL